MAFAHTILIKQIKSRQRKRTHAEHYAREVLTSDIEESIKEVTRLTKVGRYRLVSSLHPKGRDLRKCARNEGLDPEERRALLEMERR